MSTTSDDAPTAKKPTLKTIAALTGLAVPTVSRALGGAADISKSTRARVRKVADEIGYVPNRAGVRLRTGRTNVISLVLSTEHEVMNHTARLISSVAGSLRETPFHLIITPYFADEDPMKPIRYIVETGSADAVIFNQIQPADPRVTFLMERGFPFVTHGRTQWADRHAYYDFDNAAFGAIGVQALAQRGRHKLLVVAPPMDQNYARHMMQGAQEAAAALGIGAARLQGATSDSSGHSIEAAMREHLDAGHPIDGVICGSANGTIAIMGAVESCGLTIGQDIDLYCKEATPILKRIRPEIRIVQEDVATAGAFLGQAAIERVRHPDAPVMQRLEVPRLAEVT